MAPADATPDSTGQAVRRVFPPEPRAVAERTHTTIVALSRSAELQAQPTTDADDLAALNARLKLRLAESQEDLRRCCEELERFAYIASHDLRAPLRAIMTIPEWLRETLQDKYGEVVDEAEIDLSELETQSRRMDCLLTDLLTYARVGRSGEAPAVHDTDRIVRDAIAEASLPAGFTVEVGPLDPIRCSAPDLVLAIRNLVQNAVKHHDRGGGEIRISSRRVDDGVELDVTDDGPGVASEFAEKIFEMFTTLKPRDEVEGSGMGLAMVRKSVAGMGGRVRLIEHDGRGAVFRMSFPLPEAEGTPA